MSSASLRWPERVAVGVPLGACAAEWGEGPWGSVGLFAITVGLAAIPRGFGAIAIWVLVGFLSHPLAFANHHVVAGWLCLSLALADDDPGARRSLYAAMMGMATLQKLLSPSFVSGAFVGWMGLTGEWLRPVWTLNPGWRETVALNEARVAAAGLDPVVLVAPPGTTAWALGFAWTVLVVEGLLVALALRGHRAFLPLAALFVGVLPLVRYEPVFAAVLAALTALCAPRGRARWALLVWGAGCAGLAAVR